MKRLFYTLVLCLLLFVFYVYQPIYGLDSEKANILFISSYTLEFDTIPLQIKGIESVITEELAVLNMEFMDTKRFPLDEDIQLFYNLLKNKINRLPPYDAVIVGDDAALIFAMDYHEELFFETPVVFLGINNFDLAQDANKNPYFTGIVEETSYEQNIELASRLYPKATKIVGIADNTLTGRGDQSQFWLNSQIFPKYEFNILNVSELTKDELIYELSNFKEDTILLYLSMFEDSEGNSYTISQSSKYIASLTNIPVFRMSIGGVGQGIVGGVMVSYEESGRIAAEMVVDILEGVNPSEIDVIMKSPNIPYFDYAVLERYGISVSEIPENSIIINEPVSFFDENRAFIESIMVAFGFFAVILIMLMISNTRRKVMMNLDYLTKMKNRMWMTNRLHGVLSKGRECSVFFMDLDDFKIVNDAFGHAIGDELLIQLSKRLSEIKDKEIEVARFGGDEFFGIIFSNDRDLVIRKCKKILSVFEENFWIKDIEIVMSASVGVARVPNDANDVNTIMSYADTAMYSVKNSGKDDIHFFDFTMKKGLERHEYIARILRKAIENDEISIAYQPQICAGTRAVAGFEALARLKGEEIVPHEFIPVAEENGLIIPMGRQIAKQVIEQIAKWRDMGYGDVHVAINFSNAQLRDVEYPMYVNSLLEEYKVKAELVEIEVTESIFLKQADDSISFMNQLHGYGFSLSMDDFGTGYSAISYLSYVPFKKLKIDKSLLDKYATVNESRTIVSVIDLAHSLGLSVTAEGIETEDVAKILEIHGCDYMQGYLFGKPENYLQAERHLKKN